jgi:hypothetical protein
VSNGTSTDSSNNGRQLFATPVGDGEGTATVSTAKGRGLGPGAKKTRKDAVENEYRKKKAKLQEELLEVQKQRQSDFAMYVKNEARAQSFKMALAAYQTFRDHDPVEAARYKSAMESIISHQTQADDNDEGEMPPLNHDQSHTDV